MAKRIVVAGTILALVLLFWLPGRSLWALRGSLEPAAGAAISAAGREEWEEAAGIVEDMYQDYLACRDTLYFFLRHRDVMELETALRAGAHLARQEDGGQFLTEMEHIMVLLENMTTQEGLLLHTLF